MQHKVSFFSHQKKKKKMQAHENIVKSLDQEFKKVDKAYQTSELRVFGENTSKIFTELDVIRRKQINLASDHVSLESINDILPTSNKEYNTAKNFDKKEVMLKSMMEKLDDLTQAM
ncbi:hypothetical protein INT48_006729 [Thamnidium elegans]|uniref:Uncharacterized protein n=1 Tax=Thamnidium elegans TaxID=101142 RepID=A0A8H7ST72_9FUNG|nr:hypothetical protein INT48_006729 [Thamnidium elegans]